MRISDWSSDVCSSDLASQVCVSPRASRGMTSMKGPKMVASDDPTPAGQPTKLAKGRNIIAVASGKGGLGKTCCAVTPCQALSRTGQKVLLFDADPGLDKLEIQLGPMPHVDPGAVLA